MKFLVVGAGEMGRWFGEVAAAGLADADLAFADADPAVAADAAAELGGRAVSLSTDEDADANETFDAVCVAVPMSAAADVIEAHAPRAERALVDVTGRMSAPVDAMGAVAVDRERVSLHPLFARANAPGNVAVVADESGPITERLLDALEAAGNRLVETTAEEHDEAMTTVQARTHAAVLSFALAADDVPEGLTTPVYEDLREVAEQVAGNEPAVYAEISETFDGLDRVAEFADRLADADREEFAELYREATSNLDEADDGGADS